VTDPLAPLNRTLEVLRRQIAEHARQLDAAPRATQGSGNASPSAPSGRASLGELRLRVAQRLRQVNAQNPDADRQRKRIFLESALGWELGEEILRDPSFQELLDRLEAAISDHPDLQRLFGAMFE
jgi:hypothetical protein